MVPYRYGIVYYMKIRRVIPPVLSRSIGEEKGEGALCTGGRENFRSFCEGTRYSEDLYFEVADLPLHFLHNKVEGYSPPNHFAGSEKD